MGSITRKFNPINLAKFFLNQALRYKVLPGVVEAISFLYRQRGFNRLDRFNCDNKPLRDRRLIDLVVVAHNNEELINFQIKFLRKNLLDPFFYTVVDNCTIPERSKGLKEVCKKEGIGYIRFPWNLFEHPFFVEQGALAHGLVLNWSIYNYLRPRNANFIGFIDQDIFPVKPCHMIPSLKEHPLYGRVIVMGTGHRYRDPVTKHVWFVWPGFFFANNDFLRGKKLNFSPGKINGIRVDTGSMNWRAIYSKMKKEDVPPIRHMSIVIGKTDRSKVLDLSDFKANHVVEYLDDWLHMISSTWTKEIGSEKQDYFYKLLKKELSN